LVIEPSIATRIGSRNIIIANPNERPLTGTAAVRGIHAAFSAVDPKQLSGNMRNRINSVILHMSNRVGGILGTTYEI
jgi:hypothetical protein